MAQPRDSLAIGTVLDCYRITRVIGKGGFSIIYLAYDEETGDEVVIKEYLPKKLAQRDENMRLMPMSKEDVERIYRGRRNFFQEVKAVAALDHPNIVRLIGFFLANNTCYMVQAYEPGKNLGQYVHERKGGLSTTLIFQIFLPILDALALIHSKSMLHLDVKPGNIHLRHGNDPLLLDFGAVHVMTHGRTPSGQVITAGYSPMEQYYKGGVIGPWTDVYAVGASIRTCMAGKAPTPAVERNQRDSLVPSKIRFRDRYPHFLLEAVDWAMEMDPTKRPQDAKALLMVLQQYTGELRAARLSESQDGSQRNSQPAASSNGVRRDSRLQLPQSRKQDKL